MAAIPKTVTYKWTELDGMHAQAGKPVTPYTLHPSIIAGSVAMKGGTVIANLPIGLGEKMLTVSRFKLADGFGWAPVPPAAQEAETLAELCSMLSATKNPKYPDAYYGLSKMSVAERNKMAMLLFDYWGNTEYRYALITGGTFSWDMVSLKDTNDILKTLKTKAMSKASGEPPGVVRRVKYVPVRLPETSVIAAKPGGATQVVALPDPVLAMLDPDIAEIRSLTYRISDLFDKSKKDIEERVRFARCFTALRTLLEQCAGGNQEASHVRYAIPAAKKLEAKVDREVPRFKLRERLTLANARAGSLDVLRAEKRLSAVIRSELHYADDMAEEIQKLSARLCTLLVDDTACGTRCADFARKVIEKKLHGTPLFEAVRAKIAASVAEALTVLHEVWRTEDFARKLSEAVELAPVEPILKASDVRANSFLGATFAFVGAQAKMVVGAGAAIVTTLTGNLAGPPSLYIAAIQLEVWHAMQKALKQGASLGADEAKTLLVQTVSRMEKGLPPTSKVRAGLREAINERSQVKLNKLKKDFLDEFTGRRQATMSWKCGMLLFQALSFFVGCLNAAQDVKDDKGLVVVVLDILGLGGQAASIGVGSADVYYTIRLSRVELASDLAKLETSMSKLATVGMAVGAVTAGLGCIMSAVQGRQAAMDGDYVAAGIGGVGIAANMMMMWACIGWLAGTPLPGLQAAGLALSLLATGAMVIKGAIESSTPRPNLVAEALLRMIDESPYGIAMCADPEYVDLLAKVRAVCLHKVTDSTTVLPRPRNNSFVVDALRSVGFSSDHIALIVEDLGAPLVSGPVPLTAF